MNLKFIWKNWNLFVTARVNTYQPKKRSAILSFLHFWIEPKMKEKLRFFCMRSAKFFFKNPAFLAILLNKNRPNFCPPLTRHPPSKIFARLESSKTAIWRVTRQFWSHWYCISKRARWFVYVNKLRKFSVIHATFQIKFSKKYFYSFHYIFHDCRKIL